MSGEGYDTFQFTTALDATTNVDKLTDFNPWADRISLKASIFKNIGGRGALKDDAFWIGSKAHDASDRIIYNKATGGIVLRPRRHWVSPSADKVRCYWQGGS